MSEARANLAVNYRKNTSFMNTEFIHDKHRVVIATTGKQCYEITVDWWQKSSSWKQKLVVRAQHGVFQRQCIVTMRSRDPVSNPDYIVYSIYDYANQEYTQAVNYK